jgi:hypothetical protein
MMMSRYLKMRGRQRKLLITSARERNINRWQLVLLVLRECRRVERMKREGSGRSLKKVHRKGNLTIRL